MAIELAARANAADRAADTLRAEIVNGLLPPGAPLTETEQATRLGISRTPIREAFARLISEGLVIERGPRTLVVSDIDADEVVALFDLRRALDEQAARLAAQRADTAQRERFTTLAQRFAVAPAAIAALTFDDPARDGYYALVAEFDAALDAALGRSPYLAAAIASTRVHLARVRRLARDDDARLVASAAEHGAIARAIADGDPERAAAATRLHLHEALTSIRTHLKETP
jgi:DNA-binding GntR family transcriptional regulator